MRVLACVLFAIGLTGCASVPTELETATNDEALIDYKLAKKQQNKVVGESARWGGVIADVRNTEDKTVFEVVNFPLQRWGRPEVSDDSDGRFLAVVDGFIDPEVYKKGRAISFVGVIGKTQQGKIGEYTYIYPVLEADNHYLWKPKAQKNHVEIDYSPLWFRHNFYSPYYPYRHQVPVRVRRVKDNSGTPAKDRN